ncbi:MAG TPA: NAD kinase [Ornithinimicrobium sp.]|uniref:NAD kinase n=1 Tax=Ornithinimicrobium sp. TaxID=1977084 RepID=UPI002B47CE00|nr:NAD kinase [Ornithinimicrobium sp.]HKJ11732.1 NAD kinase [Ornithinimicrobium sp.]
MSRRILLVTHPRRREVPALVKDFSTRLRDHGIEVEVLPGATTEDPSPISATTDRCLGAHPSVEGAELVVVFGGDGTILRGAELARPAGVPLLGVNLGRIGFLAEAEQEEMGWLADHVGHQQWTVQERMTLEVDVIEGGRTVCRSWALNEASVEKSARERMIELAVEVDGRPLSTWGCDGVVMSTPTGSTAYAFSGGGPVLWPDVSALLLVPISAHALFARPLVLGPDTELAVEIVPDTAGSAVMWCDGRRSFELSPGSRIEVRRSDTGVRIARLTSSVFTDRLVAKFALNVQGWRGRPRGSGAAG